MEFSLPPALSEELGNFETFIEKQVRPKLSGWMKQERVPQHFFTAMGDGGWFGYQWDGRRMTKAAGLRDTLILEHLARVSPGVAVTVLIVSDLGMSALYLFGSKRLRDQYAEAVVRGKTLICIGNSENLAGSDAAGIRMRAERVDDGWVLNGSKAYVTNGLISDLAVITAITDANADRNRRVSMFLVNLDTDGVQRKRLSKQVWLPSDLTRLDFSNVFVPDDHLLGKKGRGLQQVLQLFTVSRIPISGLATGTARGAFDLAMRHSNNRHVFGRPIADFQAKAFEMANLYARMEATRLMVLRAAVAMDRGKDFRFEASMAKYLAVDIAREASVWAADLFGAASVVKEHPIHNFPMDAWAVSLAEGTQDVQKLVIFRELIKKNSNHKDTKGTKSD
jgi:alkylation response protein AidB-like acyl-CoA dehydrogenase